MYDQLTQGCHSFFKQKTEENVGVCRIIFLDFGGIFQKLSKNVGVCRRFHKN